MPNLRLQIGPCLHGRILGVHVLGILTHGDAGSRANENTEKLSRYGSGLGDHGANWRYQALEEFKGSAILAQEKRRPYQSAGRRAADPKSDEDATGRN